MEIICPNCKILPVKNRRKYCSRNCALMVLHSNQKGKNSPLYKDKSPNWKGDNAAYMTKHDWLHRNYGKASHCEFDLSHKGKRFEWANISGEYKRDVTDYRQLCVSCHKKLDNNNKCLRGHELTPENTYTNPNTKNRTCRICLRIGLARRKQRNTNIAP